MLQAVCNMLKIACYAQRSYYYGKKVLIFLYNMTMDDGLDDGHEL